MEPIIYSAGKLQVLNQLLLPHITTYEEVFTAEDGWHQIREMKVRGAPAIAIVAALSLAVELFHLKEKKQFASPTELSSFVKKKWEHLKTSRPTAVNLFEAADKFVLLVEREIQQDPSTTAEALIDLYLLHAQKMVEKDLEDNMNIGKFGGEHILKKFPGQKVRLLTHCNTGSLATSRYGTALGVIRYLHDNHHLEHAFCSETRPYNQGSRLTAYELVTDKIPATLITDSMASALMRLKNLSAVVVGADRIAANGDTANKIGTYQLAIVAKHHNVGFYVCAPITSIDLSLSSGNEIPIEERKPEELLRVGGAEVGADGKIVQPIVLSTIHVAAPGIGVWNPAFDVTPAELIDGIVTEKGVIVKREGEAFFRIKEFIEKN